MMVMLVKVNIFEGYLLDEMTLIWLVLLVCVNVRYYKVSKQSTVAVKSGNPSQIWYRTGMVELFASSRFIRYLTRIF
jgi:hypothetical protein